MQSGKSFFNQTIFGKTVRRFWPLWLLYAGIWFFVLPMPLLGQLRWQLRPDAIECAGKHHMGAIGELRAHRDSYKLLIVFKVDVGSHLVERHV